MHFLFKIIVKPFSGELRKTVTVYVRVYILFTCSVVSVAKYKQKKH